MQARRYETNCANYWGGGNDGAIVKRAVWCSSFLSIGSSFLAFGGCVCVEIAPEEQMRRENAILDRFGRR
jgi:hypothetical protein